MNVLSTILWKGEWIRRPRNAKVFLVMIGLIFFLPSLPFDFIRGMDDDWLVIYNPGIKEFSWQNIKFLFLEDKLDAFYYPLTYVSLSFDYHFFGLNPGAMRLHNILLHLASGLFVHAIILKIFRLPSVAFWAALFFLIHPMQIESVVWVSCRRQVLFGFYYFGTWLVYLHYREALKESFTSRFFYVVILLGYIACILSKPTGLLLPLTLILTNIFLVDNDILSGRWWKNTILFLIPFGVIAAMDLILNGAMATGNFLVRDFGYSWTQHFVMSLSSIGHYFVAALIPIRLSPFYPAPPEIIGGLPWLIIGKAFAGVGVLMTLVIGLLLKWKKVSLIVSCYIAGVIVVVNPILINSDLPMLVADRYFYHLAPIVAVSIVFSIRKLFGGHALVGLMILTVFFTASFFSYLPHWKNVNTLMDHMLINYPTKEFYYRSAIAHAMAGGELKTAKTRLLQAEETSDNTYFNNPDHFKWELGMTHLMVHDTIGAKALLPTFRTDTTIYYEFLSRSTKGEDFGKVLFERIPGYTHESENPKESR
jgi:hypothetical protein